MATGSHHPGFRHQGVGASRSPPLTQATHLPKEVPVTLLEISKLNPQSSTTRWGNEIMHVLRPFKLETLLDSSLPRPQQHHEDYRKWKYWTSIVSRWLFDQVEPSIQLKVRDHAPQLTYADEIFRSIRTISLQAHASYLAGELEKWEDLRRDQYPTAADFIMAYQNQFNRLKMESHEPTCAVALRRLLQALSSEIIRVSFIRDEVENLGREVDYQLFTYYCRILVTESRRSIDRGAGTPSSSSVSGRGGGSGGSRRGSGASGGSSSGRDVSYRGWRQSLRGQGQGQ
ncbi:hypothetical protein PENANT_c004G02589 [Penicillium antarcticum]|uniref:Uncharacterized protein n=1 Tax=Penicillium antarcticum TaxID=416450 RepID=A0A1V6QHC8_9EURO|nr:uncharacterized protein N7508_002193 [Penicillium antarcticum]KAJ5317685.1 hypothetical protein N7508_002193 [Penicillium antarcticum]OQD88266.1 hypothetical protein PENANT_c004G02589 [Penicillium antarcticum]